MKWLSLPFRYRWSLYPIINAVVIGCLVDSGHYGPAACCFAVGVYGYLGAIEDNTNA